MDIVNDIIAAGRRNRDNVASLSAATPPVSFTATNQTLSSIDKAAHNVAMRMKDRDKTFSGAVRECWMEFVVDYHQIARDYGLSMTQRLQYMHNMLREDAKLFYLEKAGRYATGFNQAVDIVEKEYNSTGRQTKVKKYLNTLRISNLLVKIWRPLQHWARSTVP